MRPMSPAPAVWAPLVEGEAAAPVLAAVEAIAHDLAAVEPASLEPGLARGAAGVALFFAYLEKALGRAEAGERAEAFLERAIDGLAQSAALGASLYRGFAGVAWVAEHLTAGEAEEGDDANEGIDAALLAILERGPWRGELDLTGGLVGWGVYTLERLPRYAAAAMLPLLVAHLAEGEALRDDPGMAHGEAGAIALLARALREGPADLDLVPQLAAAVEGVLGRLAAESGEGDLAWCAGAAGASAALLAAGRSAGRADWEEGALRLARAAAQNNQTAAAGFDAGLCHGTAGLSHLFHRFHQATAESLFAEAARRWLAHTLELHRPGEGIGGFLRRGGREAAEGGAVWQADPGFLGGAAGIGLGLLAAATPLEPAWDRLLLLSGRSPKR